MHDKKLNLLLSFEFILYGFRTRKHLKHFIMYLLYHFGFKEYGVIHKIGRIGQFVV